MAETPKLRINNPRPQGPYVSSNDSPFARTREGRRYPNVILQTKMSEDVRERLKELYDNLYDKKIPRDEVRNNKINYKQMLAIELPDEVLEYYYPVEYKLDVQGREIAKRKAEFDREEKELNEKIRLNNIELVNIHLKTALGKIKLSYDRFVNYPSTLNYRRAGWMIPNIRTIVQRYVEELIRLKGDITPDNLYNYNAIDKRIEHIERIWAVMRHSNPYDKDI